MLVVKCIKCISIPIQHVESILMFHWEPNTTSNFVYIINDLTMEAAVGEVMQKAVSHQSSIKHWKKSTFKSTLCHW